MGYLKLAALLAVPVALLAVPTSALDAAPTLCLWRRLFGIECWGCGITRAVSSAFHGEWARAWQYNRLVVVVLPLSAFLWGRLVLRQWRDIRRAGPGRGPAREPAAQA